MILNTAPHSTTHPADQHRNTQTTLRVNSVTTHTQEDTKTVRHGKETAQNVVR